MSNNARAMRKAGPITLTDWPSSPPGVTRARTPSADARAGESRRDGRDKPAITHSNDRREVMTTHRIGTREEQRAARLELLKAEKELTRQSDELTRRRQELPWAGIDKEYRFDTDEGQASLGDLFRGRSQLLVYHFMFGPDYAAGCPSCSSIADGFNGVFTHLGNHDVML